MKKLSVLTSFRAQLLLGLIGIILLTLWSQFYFFIKLTELQTVLQPLTPLLPHHQLETKTQLLLQSSFYFFALTLVWTSLIIIYLILTLNSSLKAIIAGIYSLTRGDLAYRINLHSNNEFGVIAKFFNQASTEVERLVNERTQLLKAEKNKLAVTLAGITDAVIAVDLERNIVNFNRAAQQLTGYRIDTVLNKPIGTLLKFTDSHQPLSEQEYCPEISPSQFEGVVYSRQKIKLVTASSPQNQPKEVNLTVSQIAEGQAVHLGNILTIHDLTAEHQLEKMKLDFVSMAVHELRTPLTVIVGYLSLLRNRANITDKQLEYSKQELLNRAFIGALSLSRLIENLLSVSKIENGQIVVQKQSIQMETLIKQAVEELTPLAQSKHLNLEFLPPPFPLPLVQADPQRIAEVLNNLIGNAINYTHSGRIRVTVASTDKSLTTTIHDTGEGIPAEAIPHLFTKFFRIQGKLQAGSKGTGLGLYICKHIIQAHAGRIWTESIVGQGSQFSFSLPLVDIPTSSNNIIL